MQIFHFPDYRFSFRKNTDFHFAKYRFSFRFVSFRFLSFNFVSQITVSPVKYLRGICGDALDNLTGECYRVCNILLM